MRKLLNLVDFRSAEDVLADMGVDPTASAAEVVGGSVPGTGEDNGITPPAPSAETQNTDTEQRGGPPETVPYSRFKEVNDAHRPFKELGDLGYDADSLRRLAEWEVEFERDPAAAWLAVGRQVMDDLPDPISSAMKAFFEGGTVEPNQNGHVAPEGARPVSGGTATTDEKPPAWAEKLLTRAEQEEQREAEAAKAQEAEAQQKELETILSQWEVKDQEDRVKSPSRKQMLTYIAGTAGTVDDVSKVLDAARGEWLEARDEILTGAVAHSGARPRSVPGSGPSVAAQKLPGPKSMAEATALARAAIEAGNI